MGEAFDRTEHNVDPFDGDPRTGLTPHQTIYHDVVERTIDKSAEQAVATGPQFQVLLAYPPSTRLPKWSTIPLMAA
jgi:hypothetical protein